MKMLFLISAGEGGEVEASIGGFEQYCARSERVFADRLSIHLHGTIRQLAGIQQAIPVDHDAGCGFFRRLRVVAFVVCFRAFLRVRRGHDSVAGDKATLMKGRADAVGELRPSRTGQSTGVVEGFDL